MFEHSIWTPFLWSPSWKYTPLLWNLRDKKDRGRREGGREGTNVNQCGFTMLW